MNTDIVKMAKYDWQQAQTLILSETTWPAAETPLSVLAALLNAI